MVHFQERVPLAQYTTFQVGGQAEFFCEVSTEEELQEAIHYAREHSLAVTIIGGGSNVLIADEGIKGLVIRNLIRGITVTRKEVDERVVIECGAGEIFDDVVAFTVTEGYWGLENLSHIPGSVGATPVQNVGAYGVEVSDYIETVRALDTEADEIKTLTPEECLFGYRDSIFKHQVGSKYVVTSVSFLLGTRPNPQLSYRDLTEYFSSNIPTQRQIRGAVIAIRGKKFPDWHQIGTAGSFFKNPIVTNDQYHELRNLYPELPSFPVDASLVKVSLGWILDKVCNMKGITNGAVGTYKDQALVIVNYGGATTKEIDTFATMIANEVKTKTGITIEREVTTLPK